MFKDSVRIGKLRISPPLFLAPMAGLTHSALRQLLLDFGGVGLLSTEMLSASSLPHENPQVSPYLLRTERERPISYQLLIHSIEHADRAIEKVTGLGADAIDINLGCSAPKVVKKGGGLGLCQDEKRLKEIVSYIRKRTQTPLTAKIRLGPGPDVEPLLRRCQLLQDLGIDAIYVHARFDKEPFARPARWNLAACAKRVLSIPFILNGGIFTLEDAKKCFEITGADGLMIGRGAAVRPWLFRDIENGLFHDKEEACSLPDLERVWLGFLGYLQKLFPKERQLGRLKEFTHYFSQNFAFGNRLAMSVQRSKTMDEAKVRALDFFKKNLCATVT